MKASRIALLVVVAAAGTAGLGLVGWWLASVLGWRHEGRLWLLSLVPFFAASIVAAWLLRQWARSKFGPATILDGLVIGRSGVFRAVRGVVWVAGLACVIVALAGPQYGSRTRTLRKRGVDVVVVLDFSKSMLARDVRPDRISRAKAEITQFIDELGGDRVGVVAYAGETMEFPMTTDYAAVDLFLRDLHPYDMPVGGTSTGRALVAAQRLLARSTERDIDDEGGETDRAQVVVLFTDGEDHEGDPMEAARALEQDGVRLYTVGIGSRTGEPIPTYAADRTWTGYLRDDQNELILTSLTGEAEAMLTQIAEHTGGKYFRARQGGVGVDQIRREMRRMKQTELEARRITIEEDRYALALLPGFLLLVLEALLPDAWIGRRRRTPVVVRRRRGPRPEEPSPSRARVEARSPKAPFSARPAATPLAKDDRA